MDYDANTVAAFMKISPTAVKRQAAQGIIPSPIKTRAGWRWSHDALEAWPGGNCRPTIKKFVHHNERGNEMDMYNVEQVAAIMNVSPRTVQRLSALGMMPKPVKLGALARWSRLSLEQWTAAGCLPIGRPTGRTVKSFT